MTTRMIAASVLAVWTVAAVQTAPQTPADAQLGPAAAALANASNELSAVRYEAAAALLDEWIRQYATPPIPDERRALAAQAFVLRARARYNIAGRREEAAADFRQILQSIDPAYQLPPDGIPARIRTLFDEVRNSVIGTIDLTVSPADAAVTLNGKPVPTHVAGMSLPGNTYALTAKRQGYREYKGSFTVTPGTTGRPVSVTLERISSNIAFVTSPPRVEVVLDGDSRGRTEPDPASAAANASKPFAMIDIATGVRKFEFRLDCHRTALYELNIVKPADYETVTVKLEEAIGTIRVSASNAPGAQVVQNGVPKGALPARAGDPLVLSRLCEGPYTIEVLSPVGRDVRRFPGLKAGQVEDFAATLRPAFAIVSDTGLGLGGRGGPDIRQATEADFNASSSLLLFAPDEAHVAEFSKANTLPPDWLKFNSLGERLDSAKLFGDEATRQLVNKLSDALNVQGIAAVARRDPNGDPADMLLILLARGSAFPDVIPWRLGDRARAREVIAEFDKAPPLLRSSIGLTPIDVMDVQGAVVAAIESGGASEAAGIKAGETIAAADGVAIKSASEFLEFVTKHQAGALSLDVRSPTGVARKVSVTVAKVPNLISLEDEGLWSNRLAVAYAALVAERPAGLEQLAARLNLAVDLLRLKNFQQASVELDHVSTLATQAGLSGSLAEVVTGTTWYLRGICAEGQREFAKAEEDWLKAAQARGNLLTENGEPLKELATRRIDRLKSGG